MFSFCIGGDGGFVARGFLEMIQVGYLRFMECEYSHISPEHLKIQPLFLLYVGISLEEPG